MRTITLPWESWRSVIAVLRIKGLPSILEHAGQLEQQLEQHLSAQATVTLEVTDVIFLRSFTWARWQLGIPWQVEA